MHLKQPGFTYSAYDLFSKTKERIEKLKKQEAPDIFIKTSSIKLGFNRYNLW